eukprot:3594-Heterococcus_DN1.PRE.1
MRPYCFSKRCQRLGGAKGSFWSTDLSLLTGERETQGRARSLRSGAACAASAAGLAMRLQQPWLRATFAFAVCAVVATCVVRALQGSHHTPLGQCSTRSVHSLAMVQRHEEQGPKQRQSEQQGLSRRSALGKFAQGVTVAAATAGMPSKTSALFEDYRKEGGCPTYEMVKGASVQNFEIEKDSGCKCSTFLQLHHARSKHTVGAQSAATQPAHTAINIV